ncbi:MAG TPA: carbohydrate-binding family 9-like protein [Bacteroidales bacterium]|nr:carbohydrate-binding family 9-like protein [Bacteroidales bacterium]
MKTITSFLLILFCFSVSGQQLKNNEMLIKKTKDFTITGDGSATDWNNTGWVNLELRSGNGRDMITKVKSLYSDKGIYFLFDCMDKKLTSKMDADFLDLWTEDVVEVFLWTDESMPVYFEYEISPLGYELPLLISNEKGELLRWMPFHYEDNRKVLHATSVRGGEKKSMAGVSAWTAEFFFPWKLLKPLNNNIPQPGTKWRANMYRVDYDDNNRNSWTWQPVTRNFHDYEKFGTIVFE